ncbi:MAG: ATP-dependent helicase [Bacteroidetes bacterium SB0662_bin_6]|nr:ATP-dependent helicase [Bacteroidetes bacterium SB0668_bin_1]MYE03895.1 ATP-dependent helicase [Bacteroidetes bacterium SB0662_bin_6]
MTLSPTTSQQAAIDHDSGNLLILACAGSGKTETLAHRIAKMVKDGVRRESIVAFTFTNHAGAELKHRVRQRLETMLPSEPSLGDMYVGTIHSYCLKVLRERKEDFRRFEVMDETRQAALLASNFYRFEDSGRGIGLEKLLSRTRMKTFGDTLHTFMNTLNVLHQQRLDLRNIEDNVLAKTVENYREIVYGYPNYFLDFNQIIDDLIDFLEKNKDQLMKLRSDLSHLFVDEYQDVDDRQERLIDLLTDSGCGPHLTVVGDDDQALYGFRGARVENMLGFEDRYPNVTTVQLTENFRSTHAIVEIADEAVRKISHRIPKEPVARVFVPDGSPKEHLADPGDVQLQRFTTEADEAAWVAKRIEELRGTVFKEKNGEERGLDYGDMAILLRSVRGAGTDFSKALRDHGIPVVVSGTGGLFDNDEVRLIQASFSLLAKSDFYLPGKDGKMQLINTVGTREFIRKKIADLRHSNHFGDSANSTHYLSWIDKMRADLDQRRLSRDERDVHKGSRIYPQALFQKMLQELGILEDNWPNDIMFNMGAFSNLLTQFESVHQWITPARLKSLCVFLSIWGARHVDEGGISEVASLNSVKIMTVHASKGLEWPVVFLPRISSHVFPSSRRNQPLNTFLPENSFNSDTYVGGDDAERRLWYVGLTRCAKFLNVSTLDRSRKRPTAYFKEIAHDCVSRNGTDSTPRRKTSPQPPAYADMLQTTYSDLATFRRCEREYQLRTLMNFSPGVGEQFGYGQQIHNILAEIHQKAIDGTPIDASEIEELVKTRFHLRYTRGDPFKAMQEAAICSLTRYVEEFGDKIMDSRAAEKSFELLVPDSDALISGVVDLLERRDALDVPPSQREIVGLVEFKATRIKSLKDYEKIHERVQDQIQLYALGVRYAFSQDPQQADIHIISHAEFPEELEQQGVKARIPIDVTPPTLRKAQEKVKTTIEDIKKGITNSNFPKTGVAEGQCKECDFRVFCSGYREFISNSRNVTKTSTPEEDRKEEMDQLIEETYARSSSE